MFSIIIAVCIYFLSVQGYLNVQGKLVKAIQIYGPRKMAYTLFKKRLLCQIHYNIMSTLKKVSISYQSSILVQLLKVDLEYLPKYQKFKQFVRTEKFLMHMYSKMSKIGNLVQHALRVQMYVHYFMAYYLVNLIILIIIWFSSYLN